MQLLNKGLAELVMVRFYSEARFANNTKSIGFA
jgi:hypothetical protein